MRKPTYQDLGFSSKEELDTFCEYAARIAQKTQEFEEREARREERRKQRKKEREFYKAYQKAQEAGQSSVTIPILKEDTQPSPNPPLDETGVVYAVLAPDKKPWYSWFYDPNYDAAKAPPVKRGFWKWLLATRKEINEDEGRLTPVTDLATMGLATLGAISLAKEAGRSIFDDKQ